MNFWPGQSGRSRSADGKRAKRLSRLIRQVALTVGCGLGLSAFWQVDLYAQGPAYYAPQTYATPAGYGGPARYPDYCPPMTGGGYYAGPQTGVVPSNYEQIPYYDDLEHTPLVDGLILDMFNNMWISMEYLNWGIKSTGDTNLGADVPSVADPSRPFYVVDASGGDIGASPFLSTNIALNPLNQFQAVAVTPTTSMFDFTHNNGFRGTVGLDTSFGGWETSVFVLQQAHGSFDSNDHTDTVLEQLRDSDGDVVVDTNGDPVFAYVPYVYVRPLTNGGVPSNNNILYYDHFSAEYDSQVWGTSSALVWDIRDVDLGWSMSAILGSKYLNVRENMRQRGSVTSNVDSAPTINSSLDSTAQNNVIAPTLGIRTEFRHQWFTLGVDPRLGLGLNATKGKVAARDVLSDSATSFNDVDQTTESSIVRFTPTFDLKAYAKVNVHDHVKLTVAYDFMWVGQVMRADDIIRYDTTGIIVQSDYRSFQVDGLSLGAEFDW